jgi:glucose-6-phosphate isomerase
MSLTRRPLQLDITRALVGPGRPLPVSVGDIEARSDALAAAATELSGRQSAGTLGFLSLDWDAWQIDRAVGVAARLGEHTDVLLVLGIGGSALGARALDEALGPDSGRSDRSLTGRRLVVLDSVDPCRVAHTLSSLDAQRTAVVVISKSGGTVETAALFRVVLPWLRDAVGARWSQRMAVITDAERGALRPLAREHGLAALPIPDDVGGRFSVLTAVGMLPAAYLGLDVAALRAGAEAMRDEVTSVDLSTNPAWRFAALHDAWWGEANISVLVSYCDRLAAVGEWFQQLWGESLGKIRPDGVSVGWTPGRAQGPVDQHSQLQLWQEGPRDKLISILRVADPGASVLVPSLHGPENGVGSYLAGTTLEELMDAERRGTTAALVHAGRPVAEFCLDRVDEFAVAGLLVFFQQATALTGLLSGVDPFDQPGVEAGKRFAYGLMGRDGFADEGALATRLLGDV